MAEAWWQMGWGRGTRPAQGPGALLWPVMILIAPSFSYWGTLGDASLSLIGGDRVHCDEADHAFIREECCMEGTDHGSAVCS